MTKRPKLGSTSPELGMVCISFGEQCRYRNLTRKLYLELPDDDVRAAKLRELYWSNIQKLQWTLGYCQRRDIRLYRLTSSLFPFSDEPLGVAVLTSMREALRAVGRRADALKMRLVLHPDQFVVLSSDNPVVQQNSRTILAKHALWFDLFGLPRTPWSLMNIHGGKMGQSDRMVEAIRALPDNIKSRLTLENDEFSYGAADILDVCRRAGVPMVFDCHHHVIKEGLDSYDHPSVAKFTKLAAATWPDPQWQVVHVSNGHVAFQDRNHSAFITMMPRAFKKVPWIEVEARAKEDAIAALRASWPASGARPETLPLRKPTAAELRAMGIDPKSVEAEEEE